MPKFKVDIRLYGIEDAHTDATDAKQAVRNVMQRELKEKWRPAEIGRRAKEILEDDRMYSAEEVQQNAPKEPETPDTEQLSLFGAIAAVKAAIDVSDTGDLSRHDPMNTRWPTLPSNRPKGESGGQHPEFYREPGVQDPDYDGGVLTNSIIDALKTDK